jgi:hypothetical protein
LNLQFLTNRDKFVQRGPNQVDKIAEMLYEHRPTLNRRIVNVYKFV